MVKRLIIMKAYKIPLLALILLLGTAPVFSQDLRNGLVAYWPLDTLSSGTTTDVAYTNTFTAVASPTSGAGQFGNALTFNGTSQYLFTTHGTTNTDTGLPVYFPGAYTICMWVKGAAQTAKGLFCEASTTSANPLLILQTGNATASNTKLDVIIRNNNGTALLNHIASQTVVFNNAWHHIA